MFILCALISFCVFALGGCFWGLQDDWSVKQRIKLYLYVLIGVVVVCLFSSFIAHKISQSETAQLKAEQQTLKKAVNQEINDLARIQLYESVTSFNKNLAKNNLTQNNGMVFIMIKKFLI